MHIREMTKDDADYIVELCEAERKVGKINFSVDKQKILQYNDYVEDGVAAAFVALIGSRLVGVITVSEEFTVFESHRVAHVGYWLSQSHFAAVDLLNAAKTWARNAGIDELRIASEYGPLNNFIKYKFKLNSIGTLYSLNLRSEVV